MQWEAIKIENVTQRSLESFCHSVSRLTPGRLIHTLVTVARCRLTLKSLLMSSSSHSSRMKKHDERHMKQSRTPVSPIQGTAIQCHHQVCQSRRSTSMIVGLRGSEREWRSQRAMLLCRTDTRNDRSNYNNMCDVSSQAR